MSYEVPYAIGVYIGTGTGTPFIQTGFYPEALWIVGGTSTPVMYFTTRDKQVSDATASAASVNVYSTTSTSVDLTDSGFIVQGSANSSGVSYYYMALMKSSLFHTGNYTGNGSAGTLIPLGFKPSFMWIIGASAWAIKMENHPTNRISLINANFGSDTTSNGLVFVNQGFKLSASGNVNTNSTVYYFVAFKGLEAGLRSTLGSVVGAGAEIYIHLGERPRFLYGERNDNVRAMFKMDSMSTPRSWDVESNTTNDWNSSLDDCTFRENAIKSSSTFLGASGLNRYWVLF